MTDVYFDKVSSLLHFDGVDTSTTFNDVKGKVWTAAGNAQIDTARSKFGGASGLLDGTGDYISTPSVADLDFGTGDFTVEGWVYIAANSTTDIDGGRGACIVSAWNTSGAITGYILQVLGDASTTGIGIAFDTWGGGANGTLYRATATVTQGAWHHVAATVSGGTRRLFLDGVLLTGTTTTVGSGYTQADTFGNAVRVGMTANTNYPLPLNGSVDDIRITKGFARYTSTFTPPAAAFPDSAPPTPQATIDPVALLHFDGADASTVFADATGKVWTAAGNAQIDTVQSKFGGASGLFDGTGDVLSSPHSADFNLTSGSFTVEAWIRPGTLVKQMAIVSHRPNAGQHGFMFQMTATGKLGFQYSNGGTGSGSWVNLAGATTLTQDVWAHVAATFDGTTVRLFINGVLDGSTTTFDGVRADTTTPAYVGRDRDGNTTRDWQGHIDDLRIVKEAVYTADFAPPTLAHPDPAALVPSTVGVVSLMHFEGSNGSTVFSDVMGKPWTVYGNAQISSAQAKFGATSCLLDGTGDAFASASPDFGFGAGNWTWEAWVRPTDATGNECVFDNRIGGAEGIGIYSSLNLHTNKWGISNNSAVVATGTNLTAGVWTHLAVSKQGTTIVGFKNGVVDFTYTDARTYASSAIALIGAAADPSTQNFNGYIDEMRITKGEARYVAGFSVATAAFVDPIDPLWSSTTSLLHFNGANDSTVITDERVTDRVWTFAANAKIKVAQSKFGGASAYFPAGSNSFASTPHDNALNLASGDFTVECWVYHTRSATGNETVVIKDGVFGLAYPSWGLSIDSAQKMKFIMGNGTGAVVIQNFISTAAIPLNAWTHLAASRVGSNILLFINGVLDATIAISITPVDAGRGVFIGDYQSNTADNARFQGYIDELRITKGVARYSVAFTPSPEPFPGGFLDTTIDPLEPLDYADVVLADSPMAYYRFNESSGTVANDSSGNGRHGTYSATGITLGTPGLLTGSGNNAATFDPASDTSQVDCGFNAELYWGCTLEAIIKLDASQPDDSATIITKRQYFASAFTEFPISLTYQKLDGKLYLNVDSGNNFVTDLQLSAPITTDVAHHVVGVYRPNGQCGLWIDGIEVAAGTFTGTIAGNARNWLIGASHPNAGGGVGQHRFKGVIDEVAIYSAPLSDARIAEHYAAYAGLPSPGGTIGGGGGGSTPVTRSYGFVS